MNFIMTPMEGLYIIEPKVIGDKRGWFMRTFDFEEWKSNIPNFNFSWAQMNHSYNKSKGTWRGFHFQEPPYQETKVVRCISGAILDCVLDIRRESSSFLQIYTVELTAENKKQLYIPKGFAHGFLTLQQDSEVLYMHDEYYHPEFDRGIKVDDPSIGFSLEHNIIHISDRDKSHPLLSPYFKGY